MTIKNHFDILVVGAGPAGAVFAYELKKILPNSKVLVIEKENIPRYKTCGGGIQFKSAKIIPFNIESVVEDIIFGIRFSYKYQERFTRTSNVPLVYNVMRDKFDAFLIEKTQELGVSLLNGCTVEKVYAEEEQIIVQTNTSQKLSCNILVGADGAMSITAKSLGLMKNIPLSFAIESEISVAPEILKKHKGFITVDCGTIRSGYAWIFPKSSHLSIGAGTSKKYAPLLKEYYEHYISCQDIGAYNIISRKGFILPHRQTGSDIQLKNVILVGDAAGLVDPFTGEGIYYAIRSAQLAASVVAKKLEDPNTNLKEYQIAVDKELMPELIYAQQLLKLFNIAPKTILTLIEKNDSIWHSICQIIRGEKTYRYYIEKHPHLFQFLLKIANITPKCLKF